MSSPTENLHHRINSLGAERVLQLLNTEQERRASITHKNGLGLMYLPHKLQVSDSWEFAVIPDVNHPPQAVPIDPLIYDIASATRTIQMTRTDPDPADTQTWTKRSGPSWVTISASGLLRIAPPSNNSNAGSYTARVRITDSGGKFDDLDISITLLEINRRPNLKAITNRTITLGQTIRINLIATDADNDTISYRKNKTVGTLNSQTGVFTWTPTSTQTITITFTADDQKGLSNSTHTRNVTITVNPRPVITPTPPILDSIGNKARTGSGKVSFTVRAKDPNDLVINFSDGSNAGTFGTRTKQTDGKYRIQWTSGTLAIGTHTVTITATAAGGTPANETDSETINIVVSANQPPVLRSIGNKTVRRGETLTFTVSADDPENDTISYTKTGVGSLNSSTGVYSYSPNNSVSLGNKTVKFTATATGGSDAETITIRVEAAPVVNASPPTITLSSTELIQSASTAGTGGAIRYSISDPDDLPLTVSAVNATIRRNPNIITFTHPAAGETKIITIRVTATGGNPANEYAEATLTLTVLEPDYSPNITITSPIDGSVFPIGPNTVAWPVVISATKYDGTSIPESDLTVTQSRAYSWGNISSDAHRNQSSPVFRTQRNEWSWFATAGSLTLTVSYTDTVNNRAYTTTKSVTVTVV